MIREGGASFTAGVLMIEGLDGGAGRFEFEPGNCKILVARVNARTWKVWAIHPDLPGFTLPAAPSLGILRFNTCTGVLCKRLLAPARRQIRWIPGLGAMILALQAIIPAIDLDFLEELLSQAHLLRIFERQVRSKE